MDEAMKTYTLHMNPDAQPGDEGSLDRAVLVKDGFSWGAFLFTFLWFFWNRLWLAGLAVLAALVALGVLLAALDVHPTAGTLIQLLIQFLIGLEATSLQRWTLARRSRPAMDMVVAGDREEAETKMFTRWLQGRGERRPPVRVPSAASYRAPEPVLGLFPDPEVRR
jgi:hypothetical protein